MFTFTFLELENENSISIWEFEKMNVLKIIFLPSFQIVIRLNSQNRKETSLLMNTD